MSRLRAAFLGIFSAQVGAWVFALLYALDLTRHDAGYPLSSLARHLRYVLDTQAVLVQPILWGLGGAGGLLAQRRTASVSWVVLAVALAGGVIANLLMGCVSDGSWSVAEFLRDVPFFAIPALAAAGVAHATIPGRAEDLDALPRWVWAAFGISAVTFIWAGNWLLWPLCGMALMAPVALGLTWRWRAYAALLTLPAVCLGGSASAAIGYVTGTARFMGYGLPRPEFFNLDPVTRAPRWNGGCCIFGPELLPMLGNDLGLWALGKLFGRMPFAYDGPYPTEEEAFVQVEHGEPVVGSKSIQDGVVETDKGEVRLNFGRDDRAAMHLPWQVKEGHVAMRIAESSDGMVVFETSSAEGDRRVWVFAARGERMVATYARRGRPSSW